MVGVWKLIKKRERLDSVRHAQRFKIINKTQWVTADIKNLIEFLTKPLRAIVETRARRINKDSSQVIVTQSRV